MKCCERKRRLGVPGMPVYFGWGVLASGQLSSGVRGLDDVSSETRMRKMSNKPRSKREELSCYNC